MDNIKQIVAKVVGSIALNKKEDHLYLQRHWENVLEKQDLIHTQLLGENGGAMTVLVDTPAWLYQMNAKKKTLLEKIKQKAPAIKNIHFRIGRVK